MTSHFPKRSRKLPPSALLALPCPMAADSLSISAPSPLPGVSGLGQLGTPRPDAHQMLLWAKAHAGGTLPRPRLKVLNVVFPALTRLRAYGGNGGDLVLQPEPPTEVRRELCARTCRVARVAGKCHCIKSLHTSCKVRPEQRPGEQRRGVSRFTLPSATSGLVLPPPSFPASRAAAGAPVA